MQEPQRLLCRLNAITLDWNSQRTTGDVLTAQDVSAGMAGLSRGPYLLLRYLWCHDVTVLQELNSLLVTEIKSNAESIDWKASHNQHRLKDLITMAYEELMQDKLCKRCHGTGVITNMPCAHCNRTGKVKRTQAEYARRCGVKPSNWKRLWEHKYHEIYLQLNTWNEIGINHLLDKLSST